MLISMPVNFVPRRHKSITESITQIYTSVSHSTAVSYFQNAFMSFHDLTGLPWWATVVIYTIALRMVTFPFAVYAQKIKARLHTILETELPAMNEELKREVTIYSIQNNLNERESSALYQRSFKKQYNKLIERDNCHPLKTTLTVWFQIPIWVCHSIGIRNIINMQPDPSSNRAIIAFTQLTVGGCLWIPNLIESDVTYIIPVVWCLTNLANIEIGALEKNDSPSKFKTIITNVFRGITIAIVPIAATVPSCLSLYWCTSSLCAFAQNLILLSPKAKQILGIPMNSKYHMDHPYRTISQRFNKQLKHRINWCISFIKTK